ncbi:hypothetical protein BDV18DRAFT_156224 [Aspergillus unguis]
MPEYASKRRKLNEFAYPDIPRADQDIDGFIPQTKPYRIRLVPRLSSTSSKADIFRAESLTTVDATNEKFVRSHHPALSSDDSVYISESVFGPPVWLVGTPAKDIHAAGLPIHYYPGVYLDKIAQRCLPAHSPDFYDWRFRREINARRFLTPADLDSLRELFPKAVGVDLLVAGFLVILFDRMAHLDEVYREMFPCQIAGLFVFFDLARYSIADTPVECGVRVSADGKRIERAGCLGLKLRMADGEEVITTPTHGFVYRPTSKTRSLMHLAKVVLEGTKQSLSRLLLRRNLPSGNVLTNSPLGRPVFTSPRYRLGTITRTFDRPHRMKPYPRGYVHDLSLITDAALPDVSSSEYPTVTDWGDYRAALDGQDVYVAGQMTSTDIKKGQDSTLYTRAAVLGTGYTWDRSTKTQGVCILWHTASAGRLSGAPLCLGQLEDPTSKVIVFQNFQEECYLGSQPMPMIQGGFVLPREIRQSTILQ